MQLFYAPQILQNQLLLDKVDAQHCLKVLRKKEGDLLHLIDGQGGLYEVRLTSANPKKCTFDIVKTTPHFGKRNKHIHIAIAPTKNISRLEWFLEKATEIGIEEITPILCHHSERKIIKPERLEKILVAAMKQSLKAYLPKLNPLTKFQDFVASQQDDTDFKAIACMTEKENHLQNLYKGGNVVVMIGPEGGFSEKEISMAVAQNFKAATLGTSRLRTETAGMVATLLTSLEPYK